MAELQRLGILPQSHLYGREWRGVRDLLRQRSRWVREKIRVLLSLQSRYARCLGVNLSKSALIHHPLPQLGDVDQELAAQSQVHILSCLQEEIGSLEQRVAGQLQLKDEKYRRLTDVHGIGPVLAATIVLESGELSRFRRVGKYASYARVVQSGQWTNFKKKGTGNRRCGNKYLGWAFHEAAHCMNRCDGWVQEYRGRQVGGGKHPRSAWSAMANKICRAFYFVMRDGIEFSPQQLFGCGGKAEGGSELEKGTARMTKRRPD
jgi:transposase